MIDDAAEQMAEQAKKPPAPPPPNPDIAAKAEADLALEKFRQESEDKRVQFEAGQAKQLLEIENRYKLMQTQVDQQHEKQMEKITHLQNMLEDQASTENQRKLGFDGAIREELKQLLAAALTPAAPATLAI